MLTSCGNSPDALSSPAALPSPESRIRCRVRATRVRIHATADGDSCQDRALLNTGQLVRVLVSALSPMFEIFTVHRMSLPTDPTPARVLRWGGQPGRLPPVAGL